LEITPPAGPHKVKQFARGGINPPLISFKADLLRFFVFEKFVFILLILMIINIVINHNKNTKNQQLTTYNKIKTSGSIMKNHY